MFDSPFRRGSTLRSLLAGIDVQHLEDAYAGLNIFERWNLRWGDLDALDISERLKTLWKSWPLSHRLLLLEAAESIVRVERARQVWTTRGQRQRYERLARQSVAAARLAQEVAALFPPPWNDADQEPVGQLVANLIAFAGAGLETTSDIDLHDAVRAAKMTLKELRKVTPQHIDRVSWDFVAELAWLASGKRTKTAHDESTIRRYLRDRRRKVYPPGAKYWKQNWNTMTAIAKLIRRSDRRLGPRFENAMRDFLRGGRIR